MAALTNPTGAVTVNVGGTVYMTTLATLTRVEGSMLGALAEALSDGEVLFIDRDGPSFRYVLNYLRDPFAKPLLPGTGAEREQLAREADFYGLPGLLSRPSTTEAAGGWDGESACTQVVTQAELCGYQLRSDIHEHKTQYGGSTVFNYTSCRQFPCRDLRGCSLRYMDLTGWNLRGCNLAGVDATGAKFAETDLRGCNLASVHANGAEFNSADLSGANLAGVDASRARFERANLSGANLSGANLQEANLSSCRLDDNTNFTGANVRRAIIYGRNEVRERVEREAARGDFFGPPFEPASPNWDPQQHPQISRSVGARFIAPPIRL